MDWEREFIERARRRPARIVYPEGHDPRVVSAAAKVRTLLIAEPVLLGEREAIEQAAAEAGVSMDVLRWKSPREAAELDGYAAAYAQARGVKETVARKLVRKPLSFGGMMVKTGDADGMVAGVASATASVISAASLTVGFAAGISTVSSFFVMVIPEFLGEVDKVLIFADCAVNVSPSARELADIGVAAGMNARDLMGLEPKIAFLSFSSKGSASHADVDKVVEAVQLARELAPDFDIDGELQADAAIVPRVAAKKVKDSVVAGQANVLVFPDLDAGNACYKLVQYLAGAKAIGPILQGFAKPVNDMSRGATVDDVVAVTAITVVQSRNSSR